MKDKEQIRIVLSELANLVHESVCWEKEAMFVAHKLGLQGEKRRNRYESRCNSDLLKHIRCYAYDMLGVDVKHMVGAEKEVIASDFSTYFAMYKQKLEKMYNHLHDIANKLVGLNMQPFAKCLYNKLECIEKDIIYCNRTISEGSKCGWKPEWIFLHQTTDYNVHDKYEDREEKNGWEY